MCNCTSKNPSVQSFDRTISPDARALVARADGGKWRFFITSEQLALVTIEQKGTLGNFPSRQQYIAPNSAIEVQGADAVDIYVRNLSPSTDTKISTWNGGYLCGGLEPVIFSEQGQTTPVSAGWGEIGTNGGYAQPYTNMLRLYVADAVRIKATDQNGTEVFLSGTQPADERYFIDLDAPQNLFFEIRENSASAVGVNFQATWFRK